jgi:hypothetical protein
MGKEGLGPRLDIPRNSAEEVFYNPELVTVLVVGKPSDRKGICESISFQLKTAPECQVPFIGALFNYLGDEGDWHQTNRRDAALAVLSDSSFKPILRENTKALADAYLKAVSRQGVSNDPFCGAIDSLLEASKILAPYFSKDAKIQGEITEAWRRVKNQFLEHVHPKERAQLIARLRELRKRLPAIVAFDRKVKEFRKIGMNKKWIMEELRCSLFELEESPSWERRHELRINRRIRGLTRTVAERDEEVAKLRNQTPPLTNPEIEAKLNISHNQLATSVRRGLDQDLIESRKSVKGEHSLRIMKLDEQVERLRNQEAENLTTRQIAVRLGISIPQAGASINRLLREGKIEPKIKHKKAK